MEAFSEATADERHYDQPLYYHGLMHRQARRFEEARREFELAVTLNSRNSLAYVNLGGVLAQLGLLEKAAQPWLRRSLSTPVTVGRDRH